MEISELTLSLMYLALPGIVGYFILTKLTGVKAPNSLNQVMTIFVLSVLAYVLVGLVASVRSCTIGSWISSTYADLALAKSKQPEPGQLVFGIVGGVVLAYLLSFGYRFNWINRIGQWLRVTKRYGDEDVWNYFHNAPEDQKNGGWLFIRDLKTNLSYHCHISTWSDNERDRELVLSDVTVFTTDTAQYLYKSAHIYLCRSRDEITIEVPIQDAKNYNEYKWEDPDKRTGNI